MIVVQLKICDIIERNIVVESSDVLFNNNSSWLSDVALLMSFGRRVKCALATQCYKYKWKNHFSKMKGDVGMSGHEKERKQEDAYTKIQTHS